MSKKKKLFVLLPVVTLLLSSCVFSIDPFDAPEAEEEDAPLGEYTPKEEDTSEESTTEGNTSDNTSSSSSSSSSTDTGSSYVPGASAISYEVKIVSEETTLTQYETKTIEVELYEYEYIEGEASPTLISTTKSIEVSDGVSLTTSSEAVLSVDGLTVSALNSGTAYLTAHWNVNDYIYDSDPVLFTVNEYIPTYTYEAKITSDLSQIEVGSEHLVDVYLYTYADGVIVDSDGDKADATDISLTSGDPSIIETTSGSLTIKALETGTTTLTAEWLGHANAIDTITIEVISSSVPEPDPEPEPEDVYTYEVKIENKEDYTSVLAGYEHENDEIPALKIGLYTYINGTLDGEPLYPSSTTEVEGLEVLSSNSSLVSINSDLTLNINVSEELTTPITISATWVGHYTDESNLNVATDYVDVYISYTPYPVYIESIAFTQSEYVLYYGGNEGGDTASVSVTYSPEVVDDNSYSISVENESIATFDPDTSTLTAVGVGSTYMTVRATQGGATGTASINVVEGKTDLLSISLSSSTYNLSYNDGYGSFTIGVGSDTSDINVTLNPENPDYKQLSVSNSDSYLDINETTTNNFVVSVSDKAKEILKDSAITTELTISSSYYSEVEAQTLTVIIDKMPAEIAHPVEGILLTGTSVNKTDTGYQSSVLYNGSLTLGTSDKDINVTILPEDAYSTNWTASVDSSDSSSSLIKLDGDALNGYTITPINGEVLTEDTEAQIIISSEGNGSDGNKLSVALTITIIHEDSYPVSLTLTEYQASVALISGSTQDITVTYSVLDQRNNPLTGYELSAQVDNSASSTDVSITPTSSTGDFTINAGSVEGEATISFYLTAKESIKANETITVIVTSQYHDISSVSYSGGDQTINVDLGGETVYGSFTVTDDMVNFSNDTNDVNPDDINQGFSLSTDSTYVSITDHTISATTYNRGEDLTATIYIYSVANPSATPASFIVSIHDNTNYNPTGIVISPSGDGITLVEGGYTYFESYYSATLIPSYADGDYIVASTDSKLSVEKDEVGYKISANENAVGAAEEYTTASIIVYPTIDGDDTYISQAETLDVTITPVLPSTISTYTVNFTFNDSLPSYAKLSIEATLDSQTINANLVGSGSNYSLTLSDVTPNSTLVYSITIDYDRETYSDAPSDAAKTVTSGSVTLSLNGNASTKGAYTEDSLTVATGASLNGILFDPTPTTKSNITVNVTFTDSNGSGNYRVPTYAKAYIGGYITNGRYSSGGTWTSPDEASTELTEHGSEGSYYYSYTFNEIYNGDVTFQIYFEYAEDVTGSGFNDWGYQWDYDYTVDRYSVKDGDTLNVTITYGDPSNCISEKVDPGEGGTTQFYFVILDQANSSSFGSILDSVDCQDAAWQGIGVFNGSGSTSLTYTTTGGSQACLYNAQVGEADAGTTISYTYLHDSAWNNQIEIDNLVIPSCDSGYAVYLCMVNSGYVDKNSNWGSWTDFGSGNYGGWITGIADIQSYIASLAYM